MSGCIIKPKDSTAALPVDAGYIALQQQEGGKLYAYITDGADGYTKCLWSETPNPITYEQDILVTQLGETRSFTVSADQKDTWTLSTGCTSLCTNIQCPASGNLWFSENDVNFYYNGNCGYYACSAAGTFLRTENKYISLQIYDGENQLCPNYTNTLTISYSADGFCGELSSTEVCEPSGRTICEVVSGQITYYYLTDGNCSFYRTATCPPSGAAKTSSPPEHVTVDVPGLGTTEVGIIETFFGETLSGSSDCTTYQLTTCYDKMYLGPASSTTSYYCSACEVYEQIDCPAANTVVDGSFTELSANGLVVGYTEEKYTGENLTITTCETITVSTCPPLGTPLGTIEGIPYKADGQCGYTFDCPASGTIVSIEYREIYTPLTPAISTEVGYSDLIYTGNFTSGQCQKTRKYNCPPKGTPIEELPDIDSYYNFYSDGGNNNTQPCASIPCATLSANVVVNTVPEMITFYCNSTQSPSNTSVQVGYREVKYDGSWDIVKSTCATITGDCIGLPANILLCNGKTTDIYTDGQCGTKECLKYGTVVVEEVKTTITDEATSQTAEILLGYIDKISQGPGPGTECIVLYQNFRCVPAGAKVGNLGNNTLYSDGGIPTNTLSSNCGYYSCPLSGTIIDYSYIMTLDDYSEAAYPLSAFGVTGQGCDGGMYTYFWGGLKPDNTCAIQSAFSYWPDMTFIYSDESNTYYADGSGNCKTCPVAGTSLGGPQPQEGSITYVNIPELSGEPGYETDKGFAVMYNTIIPTADGNCGTYDQYGSQFQEQIGHLFGKIGDYGYYYDASESYGDGYSKCADPEFYINPSSNTISPEYSLPYSFGIYSLIDQRELIIISDGYQKYKSKGFNSFTVTPGCSSVVEYVATHTEGDLLYTEVNDDQTIEYRYITNTDSNGEVIGGSYIGQFIP